MPPGFSQSAILSPSLRQQQRITPQMVQASEILQMPLQELRARIQHEIDTNPVVEVENPLSVSLDAAREEFERREHADAIGVDDGEWDADDASADYPDGDFDPVPPADGDAADEPAPDASGADAAPAEGFEQMQSDPDFTDSLFQDGGSGDISPDAEERRQFRYDSITRPPSLEEHLLRQLDALDLSPSDRALAFEVIGSLDERGYLRTPLADIAQGLGVGMDDALRALETVQAMDPPGIAARSLAECLLLQLRAEGLGDTLAAEILETRPDLIERRDPALLARTFHCTEADVRIALDDLRGLRPNPAIDFDVLPAQYVTTEATVVLRGGRYVVLELAAPDEAPDDVTPRIRVADSYRDMAEAPGISKTARDFLRRRIESAEQLGELVAQRRLTTLRVAEAIVDRQQDYFRQGIGALHPMTMGDVAAAIGVDETTVSRAVKGRWMKTPRGTEEFRKFFTTGLRTEGGEAVSNSTVKERIRQLVAAEDPANPLSDGALCEALKAGGVVIARRTVAKYREALRIAPAAERRRR